MIFNVYIRRFGPFLFFNYYYFWGVGVGRGVKILNFNIIYFVGEGGHHESGLLILFSVRVGG